MASVRAMGDISDDGFLGGRIRVLQPRRGFRAAIDSVLLPAAVDAGNGLDILDAGLGVGVAALCLCAREPRFSVTGVESQEDLAELARENARRNSIRLDIQSTDLFSLPIGRMFDQVMTNPPYFEMNSGTKSPIETKARSMTGVRINDWVEACIAHLKLGGMLTLIHRAECEQEIVAALAREAGDIEILPLLPRIGEMPKRILVRARKHAPAGLKYWPGFVLHGDAMKYTDQAEAVLRHGAELRWGDDKAPRTP